MHPIAFDPAATDLRLPAPAKINLFLHIVGRRPDGYHLLQTAFRMLDWGYEIHLRCRPDGRILRTLDSDRFVTGVTWVEGELWHGTWEADESELRRLDPASGAVLDSLLLPAGAGVSGLESDGGERFFCGGGRSGRLRAVRRPRR